jgi:hypothetical protein
MLSGDRRVSPPLTYLRAEANHRRFQLAYRPHGLGQPMDTGSQQCMLGEASWVRLLARSFFWRKRCAVGSAIEMVFCIKWDLNSRPLPLGPQARVRLDKPCGKVPATPTVSAA